MTVQEYDQIKEKVETLKQNIERSKGAQEQIMDNLKSMGINSEDEAEKKLISLTSEIDDGMKKISAIEEDLAELTDWASL